ncbi:MAG: hypothetical protein Ct9H300mP10_06890 [Methanobacteriota archaeon]|nr:MAG: hypothetical protein Ct9H300mP10_06890 [Euryarchaeota archaeon]
MIVSAPANASDEDFRIYVSVRDKANNTYPEIEIHIQTSMPELSIESTSSTEGGIRSLGRSSSTRWSSGTTG